MYYYSGVLFDLENIIKTNTDPETKSAAEAFGANENQIAIARILKAFQFWNLTDMWGDIPYFDALKGIPNVTYNTQDTIYKNLIKELTEAVAQLTYGRKSVKGDIAYDGGIRKWKKLANSLRMLMALNLSKRYPGASDYASFEFNAALSDSAGSIEDNTDNFQLKYPGGTAYRNPYYNIFINNSGIGESATIVSLLVDSLGGDLRQTAFGADRNGNPSNIGVPYGRNRSYIEPWCSQHPNYCFVLAPSLRQETSIYHIINASSVLLARAEAADRGWTNENTSILYQAGITSSFKMWGLASPDASYFAKPKVVLGTPGTNLKQIATQQYLAYYPDGRQGWTTWRRTGWPILSPAPDAINFPKVIPRRIMYGPEDYSLTSSAVADAVQRLGPNGDKMDSRVWWDKE
jgi:hypothetical protein